MFTEPEAPRALDEREPIFDQGKVLRQSIRSNIGNASIALPARTLNAAGHMTVGNPFRRTAGRVSARPPRL